MSDIALTVSVLALVAVVGLWIGNIKIRGIGFGIGGVLFGLGWGVCGVCPAPAFAGLGAGNWRMLVVLAAIFIGAGVHGWWAQASSARD